MADKIIIDGVDVSGCDFLSKEDDYYSYSGEYRAYKGQCGCSDEEMCKDHPNCFYKKALKQLKRKEQECKELKEWQEANQPTGICETCTVKSIEDMYKYEQALDEIEDIADDYNRIEKTSQYYRDGFDQIQDIINAVKGS